MADDLTAKIMADYPSFAFLLHDPEIGPLLLEAVDPNKGFDAATFQAKLAQTQWWKTSSASQRQWETLLNTDPASAAQQKAQWKAAVSQQAAQAGVRLEGADLDWWADYFLPRGLTANDPRLATQIAQVYATRPDLRMVGNIPAIGDQVKQIAGQFYVPLATVDIEHWETQIAAGQTTIQAFQSEMQRQAAARFAGSPELKNAINEGVTPSQLFASQRNSIANELEVDPQTIDMLYDPRWSKVLGVADKTGAMRPMTVAESIALARQQPEWKNTTKANTMAPDLGQNLLQTLGVIRG